MSIKSTFPSESPSLVLDFANSRKLDPRVSFDRASTGNTASYMGPDGYIKYAGPDEPRFDHKAIIRTNFILYSEDVTQAAWVKQDGHSVTANTVASPYGSNTADTINRSASNQYLHQPLGVTGLHTLSVWIKTSSGNHEFVMQHYNSTDTGLGVTTFTATEEWQRFSIQASPTTGGSWYPCIPLELNQDFHIWGAQVEKGSTLTEYIPTTSEIVTIEYLESLGLLTEEQRTNSLEYSADIIGQSNWLRSGVLTITPSPAITAPDGTTTAVALRDNGSNGQHTLYDDISVSDITTVYTSSCWVKQGSKDHAELFANGGGTANTVSIGYHFDLVNKTATYTGTAGFSAGTSATITEYPNGWFRITITGDVANTATGAGTYRFHVRARTSASGNYQGDNTDGIYVWGPQVEEGSFPTSYILTDGAAITRPRDRAGILSDNFSNFYNQDEGTFQVTTTSSYGPGPSGGYPRAFMVCDDANNQNNCIQYYYSNSSNSFGYAIWEGNNSRWSAQSAISDGESNNAIIAYSSANNPNVTVGGSKTTGTYIISPYIHPTDLTRMWIGSINGHSVVPQQHTSKIAYYPTRLSDTHIKELTK